MSKPFRGIIIYGVIIAAVFALIYIMSTPRQTNDNYTFSEFQQDLKDNAVSEIAIRQNSEIPTGVVTVTFRDTSKKLLYVENVGTITELLNEKNITYTLHDVTRSSYFVSTILPMVIMFVIMIVFFLVVSGRSAGAGGNVNQVHIRLTKLAVVNRIVQVHAARNVLVTADTHFDQEVFSHCFAECA